MLRCVHRPSSAFWNVLGADETQRPEQAEVRVDVVGDILGADVAIIEPHLGGAKRTDEAADCIVCGVGVIDLEGRAFTEQLFAVCFGEALLATLVKILAQLLDDLAGDLHLAVHRVERADVNEKGVALEGVPCLRGIARRLVESASRL